MTENKESNALPIEPFTIPEPCDLFYNLYRDCKDNINKISVHGDQNMLCSKYHNMYVNCSKLLLDNTKCTNQEIIETMYFSATK